MRILLVGSEGMLGTDLMDAFDPGCQVVAFGLADLDITDASACRVRVAEQRPDILINAAALTDVDYCEAHEQEAVSVNGHGAGNLAEAAGELGAVMVHYSTDYVFDGCKTEPYREDDPTRPLSAYGRSKLLGEKMVRENCAQNLILRTSWLFGRNGKNFIRTILAAAQSGNPLRVVNDQHGSPCYSKDLAAHTARLVAAKARGVFHVTNSGCCTWFELAAYALKCAGIPVSVQPVTTAEYPRPAPRPAHSVLGNFRLRQEGFPSMRPWQEAVREYVEQLLRQ